MFCYQCEQTAKGTGCTQGGVCGKDTNTADMQDILIHILKGISWYAFRLQKNGVRVNEVDEFTVKALFSTITNVNFSDENVFDLAQKAMKLKNQVASLYKENSKTNTEREPAIAEFKLATTMNDALIQAKDVSIDKLKKDKGDTIAGLQYLIIYGLKGMAAYADHAQILDFKNDKLYSFFYEALDFLNIDHTADDYLSMALKVGEANYQTMELLNKANSSIYGNPIPAKVRITPIKGKAILVSGHDLKDLHDLLEQTKDKGINIYTHGEMLPTHSYPLLKKYKHFVGNYGGAWYMQREEFNNFPGSILMTTNCIQKPKDSYKDRIFTQGLVRYPGVKHIDDQNFKSLIDEAIKQDGFKEDGEEKYITVGFGHNFVLSIADKVIDHIKQGKIKHFFLIGGCDGAKPGRDYYTKFAESVPKDCVILTLACGKYRFNKLDFGEIDGIPRLLDIGQCNDSYSAIQIASALAKAFNTDVNSLPLSLIISWYEQKAVVVLLTLLALGIKNIRLGPSLPAFLTSDVVNILVENFGIKPIKTPEEDLKEILE